MTRVMPGATVTEIGALLARTYFAERVEAERRQGYAGYQPWPPPPAPLAEALGDTAADATHDDGDGEALWRLLHLGEGSPEQFDPGLWADLCALGLAQESGGGGVWELTAFRGLIAARDAPRDGMRGHVHIGEDSLRFAELIMGVAPRGTALDVGSGSGISTCALAGTCEELHAIDVVPECLEATRLSMELTGVEPQVTVQLAGLHDYDPPTQFDCMAGNLPGVPVPPGLQYPPDGAGGPDGLALMRVFLERCQAWGTGSDHSAVILRFQSLGDDGGPLFLAELGELADRAQWDIAVITESRISAWVRAALTAHHALPVNPGLDSHELLAVADGHLADLGHTEYYASTLVARPGDGSLTHTDLSDPGLAERRLRTVRAGTHVADELGRVALDYYGRAHDLPDSFWELGSLEYIHEPVVRLPAIVDCLAEPTTARAVVEQVFADHVTADPIRARFLLIPVELMIGSLLRTRLIAP